MLYTSLKFTDNLGLHYFILVKEDKRIEGHQISTYKLKTENNKCEITYKYCILAKNK